MSHRRSLEEIEEIREASHFNFIKMHLLTHFRQHVERFGNIPMFSTDFSQLAHKEHIKESYKSSNKVDAALQNLDISTRRQAFELRLLNLKRLYYDNSSHGESSASSQQGSKNLQLLFGICKERAPQIRSIYASGLLRRQLKHPNRAVNNLKRVAEELGVDLGDLGQYVLRFGRSEQGSGSFEAVSKAFSHTQQRFLHVCRCQCQSFRRQAGMSCIIFAELGETGSGIGFHEMNGYRSMLVRSMSGVPCVISVTFQFVSCA
ncbi:hypothetical protein Q9L58_010734, partial [Maublancomyces gigas]